MTGLDAAIDLAGRLADAARAIAVGHFRADTLAIQAKPDGTPVTAADLEIETALRGMIADAFPDHGVLGEEWGDDRLDAPFVWVLDPIDGTKSFIIGKPLFGTLIALMRHGTPVLGVIEMPVLAERWLGVEGQPTTLNGVPVVSRRRTGLSECWLSATTPEMFANEDATAFARLRAGCRGAVYGNDCYAYGLLALGSLDLVCEATMKPFDYCALVPVVTGAGGRISDWQGEPLGLASDGRVIAAGDPAIHAVALGALAG